MTLDEHVQQAIASCIDRANRLCARHTDDSVLLAVLLRQEHLWIARINDAAQAYRDQPTATTRHQLEILLEAVGRRAGSMESDAE